jgi:putative transposase
MSPEHFVAKVRDAIVNQNNQADRSLFATTLIESVTDPYWKRALTLFRSLDEPEKRVLFEIMNQVRVDTVSECLGILDGVCALDGPREDFILTTSPDGQQLSGNLQELFLEADERDREHS